MPSTDLHYLTIDEASKLIHDRELSSVDLTQAHINRIDALNDTLHAFLTPTPDLALQQAENADREISEGNSRGPLHGIPIALKDLCDTKGIRTTYGSLGFNDRIPDSDATVTERLRDAGTTMLGKLTMSELAMMGPPSNGPEARNPWNTAHAPAGSSSGSGVGVSAGLFFGALGSDTGGSIRFPASWNGISGILPSNGRVSRAGVMPLSWTMDNIGPMCRTVEDTAIMLKAIAGADPRDPTTSSAPVPDYRSMLTGDVKGLKIGVLRSYFDRHPGAVQPETQAAVDKAILDLGEMGAEVVDVEIPHLEYTSAAGAPIYIAEGYNIFQKDFHDRPDKFGETVKAFLLAGALFTANDFIQAQRMRSRLKREVEELFNQVNLIAGPATLGTAVAIADFDPMDLLDSVRGDTSVVFNLTGCPSISVPCGFSSDGLPIGLQLSGRYLDEPTVLNAAYAYQQSNPLHKQHPPV